MYKTFLIQEKGKLKHQVRGFWYTKDRKTMYAPLKLQSILGIDETAKNFILTSKHLKQSIKALLESYGAVIIYKERKYYNAIVSKEGKYLFDSKKFLWHT